MNLDAFIATLRAQIAEQQARSLNHITAGSLGKKAYGYACGYLKALDDVARLRTKEDEGGMIEQIIQDARKED